MKVKVSIDSRWGTGEPGLPGGDQLLEELGDEQLLAFLLPGSAARSVHVQEGDRADCDALQWALYDHSSPCHWYALPPDHCCARLGGIQDVNVQLTSVAIRLHFEEELLARQEDLLY